MCVYVFTASCIYSGSVMIVCAWLLYIGSTVYECVYSISSRSVMVVCAFWLYCSSVTIVLCVYNILALQWLVMIVCVCLKYVGSTVTLLWLYVWVYSISAPQWLCNGCICMFTVSQLHNDTVMVVCVCLHHFVSSVAL